MASVETALSYAALILADSEIDLTSENLLTLVKKANIEVDKIWSDIYAKALSGQDIKGLLTNISVGAAPAGGASASGASGASAEEAAEEEKAESEAEESDDDMGFGLFD